MMHEDVAVFYVNTKDYETACNCGSTEISVQHMENYSTDIEKMDFILIYNNDNYILKNFWKLDGNKLLYTSCFAGNRTNIPLQAVSILCYESIMHIRHGAYTNKSFFLKNFPLKNTEYNIKIILNCIDLIEGVIQPDFFMQQLVVLEQNTQDFYFKSTNAVIKKYGWNCQCSKDQQKAAEKIRQECYNMADMLKNKRKWKNIWKTAYNIHNLPSLLTE